MGDGALGVHERLAPVAFRLGVWRAVGTLSGERVESEACGVLVPGSDPLGAHAPHGAVVQVDLVTRAATGAFDGAVRHAERIRHFVGGPRAQEDRFGRRIPRDTNPDELRLRAETLDDSGQLHLWLVETDGSAVVYHHDPQTPDARPRFAWRVERDGTQRMTERFDWIQGGVTRPMVVLGWTQSAEYSAALESPHGAAWPVQRGLEGAAR